jgi:hypothetical protein
MRKKVFDSYKKTFDDYTNARSSFEHFDERLRDPRRVRIQQEPGAGPRRVLFGLHDQRYEHSDQSWDVSPASLMLLEQIIDAVSAVVHRVTDALIEERFGAGPANI